MLEASQSPLLEEGGDYPLSHMAEGSVAQIVSHSYGPGELRVEPEGLAYRRCDGGDVEHMLHACAYVVVGRSEEDLGLVLQA